MEENMVLESKNIETTPAEGTVANNATTTPEPEVDYKALYEQTKAENERLRSSDTKASADVSRYKKELSSVLSKEELARREREEEEERIREELKGYKDRERIRNYSDKYREAGFSAETANKMAELLPESVSDEYFESLKTSYNETVERLKAEALNNQPKPTTGTPPTPKDLGKSEEDKMLEAFMRGAGLT